MAGKKAGVVRVALYLRVSTCSQSVDNQRRELMEAAEARGWQVVAEFADEGVSGAKTRADRPQLDALLKDAVRRKFDMAMSWSVDRLGRSLPDLLSTLEELRAAKVDLYLHQQGLDTSTPAGRALYGVMSVFAEFKRAMIISRVNAGLARRREAGGTFGRPKVGSSMEDAIRAKLLAGVGQGKTARELHVGVSVVQRVARAMTAEREEAA